MCLWKPSNSFNYHIRTCRTPENAPLFSPFLLFFIDNFSNFANIGK